MTSRKFLAIVFRLSLVASVGFGLYDAYRTLVAWDAERLKSINGQLRLECAANISDDWLAQNKNEFGNIDVAPICGPGSYGEDFITNMQEINETRSGKSIFAEINWRKPYDLTSSTVAAIGAFLAVNFLGMAALGLFLLSRWIIFGIRR